MQDGRTRAGSETRRVKFFAWKNAHRSGPASSFTDEAYRGILPTNSTGKIVEAEGERIKAKAQTLSRTLNEVEYDCVKFDTSSPSVNCCEGDRERDIIKFGVAILRYQRRGYIINLQGDTRFCVDPSDDRECCRVHLYTVQPCE